MDGLAAAVRPEAGKEIIRQQPLCPACGQGQARIFLELSGLPVHCNRLWPTRQGALAAPRGELRLAYCPSCTHVFNAAFDPKRMEYGGEYENSLHYSHQFRDYAQALAGRLVDTYRLRGKRILEIGCGQGDFLALLCRLGGNLGVGFDPGYEPGRSCEEAPETVRFVRDFFSPRHALMEPDFVCCRQVLEHLADPAGFLRMLHDSLGGRPVPVFFEVPNALFTFRRQGIWDLIYEHPSFFGPRSLTSAFTAAGFCPLSLREAFAGQYLWIEAIADGKNGAPAGAPAAADPEVDDFRETFAGKLAGWRQRLVDLRAAEKRVAIWGAGSKGVTFLNLLEIGEEIPLAVDLNPRKQGMFLPGTGQKIAAPEELPDFAPDLVLVMNPVYRREIGRHLERLGLSPSLETV